MIRPLILAPSICLGVATAVAAYTEPALALFLGFATVGSIPVTAMSYPTATFVDNDTIDRLFPEEGEGQ